MIEVIGFQIRRGTSGTLWHDAMTLVRTASWNVNHCRVLYAADEPFTVVESDLVVTGVTGTPGVRAFAAFDFDPVTKIATWTFANEITQDVLSFALRGPDPNGWVVSVLQGDADGNREVDSDSDFNLIFDSIGDFLPPLLPPQHFLDVEADDDLDLNDGLVTFNLDGNNLNDFPHPHIVAIASS